MTTTRSGYDPHLRSDVRITLTVAIQNYYMNVLPLSNRHVQLLPDPHTEIPFAVSTIPQYPAPVSPDKTQPQT